MTNEQREALEYLVDMARGHDYAEVAKIGAAEDVLLLALDDRDAAPAETEGCDCTELCEMGPTCPGGMLAGLPGSGCHRYQASPGECLDCFGGEDVCEECPAAPGEGQSDA